MILTGTAVPIALRRTRKPIQLRDIHGARVCALSFEDVYRYIIAGYEVHGDKRRVRYIKPALPKRPDLPFRHCWRTDEAAIIYHHLRQTSGAYALLFAERVAASEPLIP